MTYRVKVDVSTYQKIAPFRMNHSQKDQALDALIQAMSESGIQYNVTETDNRIALLDLQGIKIAEILPAPF